MRACFDIYYWVPRKGNDWGSIVSNSYFTSDLDCLVAGGISDVKGELVRTNFGGIHCTSNHNLGDKVAFEAIHGSDTTIIISGTCLNSDVRIAD